MKNKKIHLLMAPITIMGCDYFYDKPLQKTIPGVIDNEKSGIIWGGDNPFYSAYIRNVETECIPHRSEGSKANKNKKSEYFYDIAITAEIKPDIIDESRATSMMKYSKIGATIKFEAVSNSSVVINSDTVFVKFSSGVTLERASAKIMGLNEEEIKRIKKIRASWVYG